MSAARCESKTSRTSLTCVQIHLVLPNLAELKVIVSRLSHLSDNVAISANHVGGLRHNVYSWI